MAKSSGDLSDSNRGGKGKRSSGWSSKTRENFLVEIEPMLHPKGKENSNGSVRIDP